MEGEILTNIFLLFGGLQVMYHNMEGEMLKEIFLHFGGREVLIQGSTISTKATNSTNSTKGTISTNSTNSTKGTISTNSTIDGHFSFIGGLRENGLCPASFQV